MPASLSQSRGWCPGGSGTTSALLELPVCPVISKPLQVLIPEDLRMVSAVHLWSHFVVPPTSQSLKPLTESACLCSVNPIAWTLYGIIVTQLGQDTTTVRSSSLPRIYRRPYRAVLFVPYDGHLVLVLHQSYA